MLTYHTCLNCRLFLSGCHHCCARYRTITQRVSTFRLRLPPCPQSGRLGRRLRAAGLSAFSVLTVPMYNGPCAWRCIRECRCVFFRFHVVCPRVPHWNWYHTGCAWFFFCFRGVPVAVEGIWCRCALVPRFESIRWDLVCDLITARGVVWTDGVQGVESVVYCGSNLGGSSARIVSVR